MPKFSLSSISSRRGFTLIELMVVISIIGILATVGLVIYRDAEKSARDSKRVSDIQEIQKALEQYYAINNGEPISTCPASNPCPYPSISSFQEVNDTNFSGNNKIDSYFQNGVPPQDPAKISSSYKYQYMSCGGPPMTYILCAKLEDPSHGANDDDNSGSPNVSGTSCAIPVNNNPKVYYCVTSLSQ